MEIVLTSPNQNNGVSSILQQQQIAGSCHQHLNKRQRSVRNNVPDGASMFVNHERETKRKRMRHLSVSERIQNHHNPPFIDTDQGPKGEKGEIGELVWRCTTFRQTLIYKELH